MAEEKRENIIKMMNRMYAPLEHVLWQDGDEWLIQAEGQQPVSLGRETLDELYESVGSFYEQFIWDEWEAVND